MGPGEGAAAWDIAFTTSMEIMITSIFVFKVLALLPVSSFGDCIIVRLSAQVIQYLIDTDIQLPGQRGQYGILVLQVPEQELNLLFSLEVDQVIALNPQLRVPVLQVLRDHDQRHEEDLQAIGQEEP
jgi:hypothetical protein